MVFFLSFFLNDTPLHQAAFNGRYEVVNLLLKNPKIKKDLTNEIFIFII